MVRLARWGVLLTSLLALATLGRFYLAHPDSILEFDQAGLRRLAALILAGVASVALIKSIFRGSQIGLKNLDQPHRPHSSDYRYSLSTHPFRLAFRKRPVLATMLVTFLISIPPVLLLISPWSGRPFDAVYWSSLFLGELIVVVILLAAWRRAGRKVRPRKGGDETP